MNDPYRQPLRRLLAGMLHGADALGDDDDLLKLGLDSMGIMRLVTFIEEKLGVALPDDEIEASNVRTLGALVAWIERHR
ncbi:MAG: acyl carrier protein [Byssovorax sp.]